MSRPTIALLSSPFLGARIWRGLVEAARHAHWPTAVVTQPTGPPDAATAARGYASGLPDGEVVLLAHSNAGLYVPGLVTDHPGVRAVVLMDAVLVPRGETTAFVAPPALIEHVEPYVSSDGLLPVWTDWWDQEQIDAVLPGSLRTEVVDDQPRVPLSYLRGTVQVPTGWERVPACYMAFGDTYEPQLTDARSRGWTTVELPGTGHLHMVVNPQAGMSHVDEFLTSV